MHKTITFLADLATIAVAIQSFTVKFGIPTHVLTFISGILLGASLAWTACVWLPSFRKKRLLEKYKQQQATRRFKHLLANAEFMKRFHYIKSRHLNVSLLCNDNEDLVCPECAKQNMEVVLPVHSRLDSCVVCPRCGHVVEL